MMDKTRWDTQEKICRKSWTQHVDQRRLFLVSSIRKPTAAFVLLLLLANWIRLLSCRRGVFDGRTLSTPVLPDPRRFLTGRVRSFGIVVTCQTFNELHPDGIILMFCSYCCYTEWWSCCAIKFGYKNNLSFQYSKFFVKYTIRKARQMIKVYADKRPI